MAHTETPAANPAVVPGATVRYHGSLVEHHGLWRVRGVIKYGPNVGRVCLENPDNLRETLIPSLGNQSFTVVQDADEVAR